MTDGFDKTRASARVLSFIRYTGRMKRHTVPTLIALGIFIIGFALGGYFFSHIQPRSLIHVANCSMNCLSSSEIKGLLISAGIQWVPGLLPHIIKETDTVLVIESPDPSAKIDYLILPKRDIKDLGQLTVIDRQYIDDTFVVIAELIQEKQFKNYQVVSNGPLRQRLNYLHFHLLVND
jgi:diadenosine tetraphosphate (Ap4A) HIT family hydrolase